MGKIGVRNLQLVGSVANHPLRAGEDKVGFPPLAAEPEILWNLSAVENRLPFTDRIVSCVASRGTALASEALLLLLLVAPTGCGGTLVDDGPLVPPIRDAGPGTRLVPFASVDAGLEAAAPNPYATALEAGAYVEPVCPVSSAPPTQYDCDPWGAGGCPSGSACYPFPPSGGDPCNPGPFVMRCAREGRGGQGDACGNGVSCEAGHVCAVTGQGDQCVRLCKPGAIGGCPDGMVCGRLDIPGIGGCL